MKENLRLSLSYIIYLILSILLVLFTFYPSGRLFAFSFFQGSSFLFLILIGLLLFVLPLIAYLKRESLQKIFENDISDKFYKTSLVVIGVVLAICFYLFKSNYHFLGDGYGLLSLLNNANPLYIKLRNYGESLIHLWVYGMTGSALLTYQMISIIAGIFYFLLSVLIARVLFKRNIDRLILLIVFLTAGNMLLFFGYVENYSIFNLSVLLFVYTSILICKKRVARFIIIPVWGLTLFFHMFGLFLFPVVVYLLIENYIKNISGRTFWLTTILLSLFGVVAVYLFTINDYFVQVSMLPISAKPYTPDGYTLFSISHFVDFVQILFILFPAFFILIPVIKYQNSDKSFNRLFVLSILFVLLGLFLIDPKLGMARDWDLFAFAAIPLSIYLIYKAINRKNYTIIMLMIALSLSILIGRVGLVNSESKSIAFFKTALENDRVKNRNSWAVLINYYKINAQPEKMKELQSEWNREFPENSLVFSANTNYSRTKNLPEAFRLARQALKINPAYPDAYAFLGFCHLEANNYDSALYYLQIGDALSPNRPFVINNIGITLLNLGEIKAAEDAFLKAFALDTTTSAYAYSLARFYRYQKDITNEIKYLEIAVTKNDAAQVIYRDLLADYLVTEEYQKAKNFFNNNENLKNDSLIVNSLSSKYRKILLDD